MTPLPGWGTGSLGSRISVSIAQVLGIALVTAAMSGCDGFQHTPSGGEAIDAIDERYLQPRVYPGDVLRVEPREAALDHVRLMHEQTGTPHVAPGDVPATGTRCLWKSAGPSNINGRVTSISIAMQTPEIVFVASVGGVWRSTDRARRWQRVLGNARPGVFGAVVVDGLGETVYAGGGDPNYQEIAWGGGPGIWRSTDGGDSWSHESVAELDRAVIFRLIMDPNDPDHVFAATSAGVWVRASGSWVRLSGMDAPCSDIAVDFSTASPIAFAGIYEDLGSFTRGVWRHVGSWEPPSSAIPQNGGIIALAMAPSTPATIYAKVQKQNSRRPLGVWRTTNGGTSWSRKSALSNKDDIAWYTSGIAVHPGDPDVVWLGLIGLYRSTNGGANWTERKFGDHSNVELHIDQHAIAFDPADPNFLYVGNDGGLIRSTDMSAVDESGDNKWHWESVSHGMVITEFYRIATRSATGTLLGGGTQDNGTALTFGNRTWYVHQHCDGGYVAVDAANVLGVYESCDGSLVRYGNPVPGKIDWGSTIVSWPGSFKDPHDPVATDPENPGHAVAVSWLNHEQPRLKYTTTNGATWTSMPGPLPDDATVTAIAVAPAQGFTTFYVGYRSPGEGAGVRSTANRGTGWTQPNGFPDVSPNAIAVDPNEPTHAFVAVGGNEGAMGTILRTTDSGKTWVDVGGSGATGLPEAPMTGVAIDPVVDPVVGHVIYACGFVGVFRGIVADDGSATWAPFDQGLPEGLDVNDMTLNTATRMLSIGTRGYGVYERYVGDAECPQDRVLVRDNVFDRGNGPALIGEPNPEDPVDLNGDGLWAANSSVDGSINWWTSTDIRVAVKDAAGSAIPDYDHVEFESCPIWSDQEACPRGMLWDARPNPGDVARVFVQVTNHGLTPMTQVRVTALWFGGSVPAPPLPGTFWSASFPTGSGCAPISANSGWQYVDPAKRCDTIDVVNPGEPRVASFDWQVPPGAQPPFQYLAVIESNQAPLGSARGDHDMDVLVPNSHQVALRSLNVSQVVTASAARVQELIRIAPTGVVAGTVFTVTFGGREPGDEMRLFVPQGAVDWIGAARDTASDSLVTPGHMIPAGYAGFRADSVARGEILTGSPLDLALVFFPGHAGVARPRYLHVVARNGVRVLGGMTWVVRPNP